MFGAWTAVERLIRENQIHRSGFRAGEVTCPFILGQLLGELGELVAAPDNPEEVADVLGILFHYAIKQGWSYRQLDCLMQEKFKARFSAESADSAEDTDAGDDATRTDTCKLNEAAAKIAELEAEKKRRVYYQDIVYAICNILDRAERRLVCGTVETPTTEVQDAVLWQQARIATLESSLGYHLTRYAGQICRCATCGGEGDSRRTVAHKRSCILHKEFTT